MLPCGNIFAATTTATVENPTSITQQSAAGSSHPAWQVRRGTNPNSGTRLTQAITPGGSASFANTVVTNGEVWTLFQEYQHPTYGTWSYVVITNQIISSGVFPGPWILQGINTDTNCTLSWNIKNNNTTATEYYPTRAGILQPEHKFTLQPGWTTTFTLTVPCIDESLWDLRYFPYGDVSYGNVPPVVIPPNTTPPPSDPIDLTPPTPIKYLLTNSPIQWSGTNDTRDGNNALYDALTKFAAQNDFNLRTLQSNALRGTVLFSNIINVTASNNIVVNVTNSSGGSGTNEINLSDTNIVSAINSFHHSYTNGTGAEVDTNYSSAVAGGTTSSAPITEGIDEALADLGSAPGILTGGSPDMTINFMGQELNLDPNHFLPGAMPLIKSLITLIATIFFSIHCAKLLWEASKTYSTAQTGGVPNIEGTVFGIGGNVAGASLAIVIPAIFILVWVTAFLWFFSTVLPNLGAMTDAATGITLTNSTALYLLNSVFPISLLLTFAWTKVALYLGASKVIVLASSISRYLFGK